MDSIKPKKFLGQHFLTDLSVAQRIANTVDACPDIPILEVGPGMGVLTQYIIPKQRPFKVVEIDFDLQTNSLFAPGIVDADLSIIPNDEVVVVRNDEVVGVGKAVLTGKEMIESRSGIGVKIRHRKK